MRLVPMMAGAVLLLGCNPPRAVPNERPPRVRPETTVLGSIPMTRQEIEREQRLGTPVDTIIVRTTQIDLRVGETYSLLNLAPVGRDRAGQAVPGFGATFIASANDSNEIYDFSFISLRALRPGVDTLYVEALPREPSKDPIPRRPSTRVTVSVRP